MKRRRLVKVVVLLSISILALTLFMQPVAALTLENVRAWLWADTTSVYSVARGDVDGDGNTEIVTGGYYNDGTRDVAQLCVWNGATLALENVRTWSWGTYGSFIKSVFILDVDGDGDVEIVTGGDTVVDGDANWNAQLCVWNGATLALENVQTWKGVGPTHLNSLVAWNVDGDLSVEIVTSGMIHDGTNYHAQLCVWNGATLALENSVTWRWGPANTWLNSVTLADVDHDSNIEIITGGDYSDGTRDVAQLCVWNGADLALENVRTWYWTSDTEIISVVAANVDGDADVEIVTGGRYNDGTREWAQLVVWNGPTLALENVRAWYWTSDTEIYSLTVGNPDNDAQLEIVTGGWYNDFTRDWAQLVVWNAATLALENVQTWYWTSHTRIGSVAVGDVDGDAYTETITGGWWYDGAHDVAQLCVWG